METLEQRHERNRHNNTRRLHRRVLPHVSRNLLWHNKMGPLCRLAWAKSDREARRLKLSRRESAVVETWRARFKASRDSELGSEAA